MRRAACRTLLLAARCRITNGRRCGAALPAPSPPSTRSAVGGSKERLINCPSIQDRTDARLLWRRARRGDRPAVAARAVNENPPVEEVNERAFWNTVRGGCTVCFIRWRLEITYLRHPQMDAFLSPPACPPRLNNRTRVPQGERWRERR
jgi:hypothetical protein